MSRTRVGFGQIDNWTLIGCSLMGDAVSHAVLPRVALSYLLGAPFAIGALLFALIAVGAIGIVRDTTIVKEDAVIGVVFTTMFALGVVLISKFPSQVDLNHILFGNLLGVPQADMKQVFVLGGIALVIMVLERRNFTLFAFDRTQARAVGINPTVISALMLTLLALTTVVALQAVGVILVVAMLITPGATAYLLTHSFGPMLLLAPAISVVCALVGIYASFYFDVSSGGSVVLSQGLVFLLAYLFRPSQGMVTRVLRRHVRVPAARPV